MNTFLSKDGGKGSIPRNVELSRASTEEKEGCIARLSAFQRAHEPEAKPVLERLRRACLKNENTFEALLDATEHCSLGQITRALYEIGGEYRRNL